MEVVAEVSPQVETKGIKKGETVIVKNDVTLIDEGDGSLNDSFNMSLEELKQDHFQFQNSDFSDNEKEA